MMPLTALQNGINLMTGGQSSSGLQTLGEHFLSGILGMLPRHASAALRRNWHPKPQIPCRFSACGQSKIKVAGTNNSLDHQIRGRLHHTRLLTKYL